MHNYYYDRPGGKGRCVPPPTDCPPICLTPPRQLTPREQRARFRAWKKSQRKGWKKVVFFAVTLSLLLICVGVGAGLHLLSYFAPPEEGTPWTEWTPEEVTYPTTVERAPVGTGVTLELSALPEGEAPGYQEIYDKCLPSVVSIEATGMGGIGEGSGIIMTSDGYILTNNHVIEGSSWVEVVLLDGSERRYDAKLVGRDSQSDLAVLKVEAEGLTPAEFGNSSLVEVGDPALALGNPLGAQFAGSMTDGMISFRDRGVTVDGYEMELLQTTAALNSGNSGGALLNAYGQVIGVTTLKMMSESDTIEGLGFAIPTRTVKEVADTLIATGHIGGRPTIGITGRALNGQECSQAGIPGGVLVVTVEEQSDAWKQGLRPGDIITQVNGTFVASVEDINEIKEPLGAGDALDLTIRRDGSQRNMTITLVEQYMLDP